MNIIVCLDDNNGMLFNNRRQSRDKFVIKDILESIDDNIYIQEYSKELFVDYLNRDNILVVDKFDYNNKGYFFIENYSVDEEMIDKIIIYKWNRVYPSDVKFSINLSKFNMTSEIEFEGYSHEKITKQCFERVL